MKLIKDAVKGDQSKGIHGDYCSHCGHDDEGHFKDSDCDCICHDEK